jgi:hypothetical protein
MVNVFITVDTEVWPHYPSWRETALSKDIDLDVFGRTQAGEFGISYQMDILNRYELKAVFFVEALFACVVGLDSLRRIVGTVQEKGHEVQLHLHTEWLEWMDPSSLPGRRGQNLKDFSEEEQLLLISQGLQNLRNCGVRDICAFRAGNYGANFDTLRALARIGVRYDTSHNSCYLDRECGLRTPDLLTQPRLIHGTYEFPISFFTDWLGHYRHAQLCACSSGEMENALIDASKQGWYSFVLISHSFELIKGRKGMVKEGFPDRIVIRRFENLCRFLADNKDKFRTTGFSEVDPETIPAIQKSQLLCSSIDRTAWRLVEQLARKVL